MTEYSLLVMGYLDPTLVEEVELLRTESRLRSRLRTAAIAACVCAALLGTVGAVAQLTGVFRGDEVQYRDFRGYEYRWSGIEVVPREEFNAEFLKALEENEDGKLCYLNREGLQRNMGYRLAENSVLQTFFQGQCAVQEWSDANGFTLWERYAGEGVTIYLRAWFYFSVDGIDWSEPSYNLYKGAELSAEHYELPDGSTALIQITSGTPEDGRGPIYHFYADFVWDGVAYSLSVGGNGLGINYGIREDQKEEVQALLETILDSFD